MLVGQSGSIIFSSDALTNTQNSATCTWTIQANNRRTIKIKLQPSPSSESTIVDAYVVELFWGKDAKNETIMNFRDFKPKITKY